MSIFTETFSELIDLCPDPVITVDDNGKICSFNNKALLLFGYEAHEFHGQPLSLLLPEHLRKEHVKHIQAFFERPSKRKMGSGLALSGRHKDGSELDLDIALSFYNEGTQKMAFAVIRDVSEMRAVQRQLLQKNKHLETVNAELEKFTYLVSHDLKSPLNTISDLSNLIMMEVSDEKSAEVADLVSHLKHSIRSMQKLIKGILAYSKLGINGSEPLEQIALNETLNEVYKLISLPRHFTIEVPRRLPIVMGNSTKLVQVFLNLCSNAVKYNDKEHGLLRITYDESPTEYTFAFDDNGTVVPPEEREKIFALFSKEFKNYLDDSSHGIGLATVEKIIEDRGGRIWYEESPLGGSNFKFTWPRALNLNANGH